jgi:hypothetical protein
MSYDQMNIGGRCAPGGVACPAPMALPTYTQACAPKIPMPVYQPVIHPQQQFGVVGGPSTYTPPPAISYGSQYVCYNAGHQSYNQTIGTLASIIAGAIYSTPMNGGAMPGQLAAQGGSNPYAAYCPPGQDPNQYYQENCGCNPPSYHPQPYPCPPTHGGRGGYTECDPCKPRGPKPYDHIFSGPPKHDVSMPKAEDCKSQQWEAKASGDKGTIKISDRYEIKLDETNSKWTLVDKCENKTTTIWGDPHLDTQANGNLQFKETMSFILEDGTKITVKTTPYNKGDGTQTLSSELYITNGDKSIIVKGLANDSHAKTSDGDLKVVVSETNGKAVDALIDDGALTVYQVGDLWVNGATRKQLTQSEIDNAEENYDGDESSAIKGSDKKDDKLKGTDADDIYIATDGLDKFDGKGGTDMAVFSGDVEDYKITLESDGTIIVKDDDGNVTRLKDVEKLKFGDETFTVKVGDDARNAFTDGEGRELVFGKGGDDTFTINGDNSEVDYFNGGAGSDTLVLTGKLSDYDFSKDSNGNIVVEDADGRTVAVLKDVEKVTFADGKSYSISNLIDGNSTPDQTTVTLTAADAGATTGNDTITLTKALAELGKDNVNKVVIDALGGTGDTLNLAALNGTGTDWTFSYNSTTDTVTLTKGAETIEVKNVEKVQIGGTTYDFSSVAPTADQLTAIANYIK